MARIRTIKPEFPQSESMGRISRDARLLFILLWTIVDDEGRARADSRMLARVLYPYDDGEDGAEKTSRTDIERWLGELESQECVVRYSVDGNSYLQIHNWLTHQKIDKPSKSKIPEFDGVSRILANPRESSRSVVVGSGSGSGSGSGREEDRESARARGTAEARQVGVIPTGSNLTRSADEWRTVAGIDAASFERWLGHLSTQHRLVLNPEQRTLHAEELVAQGDAGAQAEVVKFSIARNSKSLIPLADVRARRDGMSRSRAPPKERWRPPPDEPAAEVS